MSNKAMNWAWDAHAVTDARSRFLLVALADHGSDHAGEDWTCFPSNERLSAMTGMPMRTIERSIKWLEERGWISRTAERDGRGRLRVRRYQLHRGRIDLPSDEHGFPITEAPAKAEDVACPPANMACPPANMACPPANMAGGEGAAPPAKIDGSTRQNGASPPANMAGGHNIAEPPEEPLENPQTGRARSEVDPDFEAVFEAWSARAPGRAARPLDAPAWRAAALRFEPERLRAAALRYLANDPDAGRHGPMSLHRWLGEERYEPWLPKAGAVTAAVASAMPRFEGPAEIRAAFEAVVPAADAGKLGSYFEPCGWRAPGVLLARTGVARDWLERMVREPELAALGLVVELQGRA